MFAKKHASRRENLGLVVGLFVTLAAVIVMDRSGLPQKWHAAIFGTTLPFTFAVISYPSSWLTRWSFWAAVAICLAVHLVGIWIFFQYVLGNVQHFGWGLWLPVAAIESIVLLIVLKRIEDKLTGTHEIVTLWE
jgi:hypothetical protein